jgi:hypothetical protein
LAHLALGSDATQHAAGEGVTFSTYEASRELGDPVQLFFFKYGPDLGNYYAYTDHTDAIVYSGVTYTPVPVARENVSTDGTLDKSTIKITVDIGTDIAELFRVYPPAYVVSLVIRQGHIGDPDEEFLVIWAGRVVADSRDDGETTLNGEPISTSMRRPMLRRHYQYGCMHALYSVGPGLCNADKASKTLSATVASVTGATVTMTAGWNGSFDKAKFLGGFFEWVNDVTLTDRRTIIRVAGDTLSLSGIPKDVDTGDTVSVILGCNHQAYAEQGGDCAVDGAHAAAEDAEAAGCNRSRQSDR